MHDRTVQPPKRYTGGKEPDPARCYRCAVPFCPRYIKAAQVMCYSHWIRLKSSTRAELRAILGETPPNPRRLAARAERAVKELRERNRITVKRRAEPWRRDDMGRHIKE